MTDDLMPDCSCLACVQRWMKDRWFAFVLWVVLSTITAAGLNRDVQYRVGLARCDNYREDLALSIGMALLPPAWIMAPFTTGFYEHGFGFLPRPECANGASQ